MEDGRAGGGVCREAEKAVSVLKGLSLVFLNLITLDSIEITPPRTCSLALQLRIPHRRTLLYTHPLVDLRRPHKIDIRVSGIIDPTQLAVRIGREVRLDVVFFGGIMIKMYDCCKRRRR